MRTAFITTLTALAEKDKNVWLVTGDLGFSVFEDFIARFPKQYLNIGVAEQNLIGACAGLALAGKRPYAYSISTFATMRPFEQIRNDVCYQDLPVTIIGGGSAFSYSTLGCTHFALEDLGIMRALPNMRVLSPGDPVEVAGLLRDAYGHPGPTYMRIAKKGEPVIHPVDVSIRIGIATRVREGSDVTIIASGRILAAACAASDSLKAQGISARVVSMHTLKPLDESAVLDAVKDTRAIVTCEEHSQIGGLASAVAETLMRSGSSVPVTVLAIPDEFPKLVGSQDYFLKRYHLDATGIVEAAQSIISKIHV
jgi:transketolase